MKRILLAFAWVSSAHAVTAKDNTAQVSAMGKQSVPLSFAENVGQIKDQNNQRRNDIQFRVGATNGLNIFIGNGAIHYQFSKTETEIMPPPREEMMKPGYVHEAGTYTMDRMDVQLVGANTNAKVIAEGKQDYYENYFTDWSGEKGAMAHTYNRITYKDVYPNIDWVFYMKDGQMKHEFVVRAGGKVSDIKLKYGGANSLKLNLNGSLAATTPQGTITENAPASFDANGKVVNSRFVFNDSILSYQTDDYSGTLTIDPGIVWSTYFGGNNISDAQPLSVDGSGNIYFTGWTQSTTGIATSGAYHTTLGGGYDAYLSKFNSSGALQWATYYGGSGGDEGYGITTDGAGNVFITGVTASASGIATSGAYQTVYIGGLYDVFLAKFNGAGLLQWGTYYGGNSDDKGWGLATDGSGNVYVTGWTYSSSGIATPGAYQTTLAGSDDVFIAKFNNSGAIQWSTYFGGSGSDMGLGLCVDGSGYIYITGETTSPSAIATSGAYQTTYGGGLDDAFLAKFNNGGNLQYATYFGGGGNDIGLGIGIDGANNLYINGQTSSTTGIATIGSFQAIYGGGTYDAFLAKFNNSGAIQWATYYGGSGDDESDNLVIDASNNLFIVGRTNSSSGIATSGAYQTSYGGAGINGYGDAFLSEFNSAGNLQYATYFGGTNDDLGMGVGLDNLGDVYISGQTWSTTGIATSGAYQTSLNGLSNAFLAKLYPCSLPTVSSITGPAITYMGTPITLSDSTSGGVWSSTNTAVATIGSTGIVMPVSQGVDTLKYTVANSCGSTTVKKAITVAGAVPCYLPSFGLVAWYPFTGNTVDSSGNGNNGMNYGATLTTDRFGHANSAYYFSSSGCGTRIEASINTSSIASGYSINLWVNRSAVGCINPRILEFGNGISSAGDIQITWPSGTGTAPHTDGYYSSSPIGGHYFFDSCSNNIWYNLTITYDGNNLSLYGNGILYSTTSIPVTGAVNLFGNVAFGRMNHPSYDAFNGKIDDIGIWNRILTPCEISYLYNASCSTVTITGSTAVCSGSTTVLSGTLSGGIWTSSNIAVATVGSSTGIVTGVTGGTATITYTLGSGCYATQNMTVNAAPTAGTISGASSLCQGSTTTLTDATTGGVWSSSSTNATVGSTGVVTGVTAGTASISYTVTTACGSATATKTMTINPLPNAGAITGTSSVCIGATTTLTDGVSGGTWSSSSTGIATVSGGVVTGVSAGSAIISYGVTNVCGTAYATKTVNVSPAPTAGTISGSSSVCTGLTTTYTESVTGGIWGSTNGNASMSGGGILTGVTAGVDTIEYIVINSCGSAVTSMVVTVNPSPSTGTITGTPTACVSATTTLSDATPGGTWSSSSTGIATVSGGVVSGVSAGSATISYTVTNSCGTAVATQNVTINPLPNAGTILGGSTVCVGSNIALSDISTGGTWSITNARATVSGGIVTGLIAGVDTIIYTVTNSCGTATASKTVTVNPLPNAGTITGLPSVCAGSAITLTDATLGGIWSSSTTTIATVGTTGIVTGVSAGTATISYTVTNTCGTAVATLFIAINPLPIAGSITGLSSVCIGSNITLTDASTGGLWSATNSNVIVSGGGLVFGIVVGIDTINYIVTNSCGTATASKTVTVNPLPNAGIIVGLSAVCPAASITLTDASIGGIWLASNGNATILAGLVTGITAGVDTMIYTVTNSCGIATTNKIITINPLPNAGTIIGGSTVCIGSNITLTNAVTGGLWAATNGNAIVTTGGVVYGMTTGIDTIIYSVTNSCGTVTATKIVSVNSLPNAGTITGSSGVCIGATTTLTNTATGGVWSATNGTATVTSTGLGCVVNGIALGVDTIVYTVTNSCGTAVTTFTITVNPMPFAGVITGMDTVCMGGTITLTDTTSGGVWSIATGVSSVTTTGIVLGVNYGFDTVLYIVTNSCGSAVASHAIFVNQPGECNAGVEVINEQANISVIPNPNKGMFTVKGTIGSLTDDQVAIEVTDMLGQVVYKNRAMKQNGILYYQVHLSNIANAMYILSVRSGNEVKVFHIVVEQ